MFSSTLNSSPPDHVEAYSISDAHRMSGRNIVLLHVRDDLNNLIGVSHLPISDEDHMTDMTFLLLLHFHYVEQGRCYLCSAKVSIKILNFIDSFLDIHIVVCDTLLKHPLELAAKRNNIED